MSHNIQIELACCLFYCHKGSGKFPSCQEEEVPRRHLPHLLLLGRRVHKGVLQQRLTLTIDATLGQAIQRLMLALPHRDRVPITAPDRLLIPGFGIPLVGPVQGAAPEPVWVAVTAVDQSLSHILDPLCTSAGLRWRASRSGIVIDQPIAAAELQQLSAAYATNPNPVTAEALVRSTDNEGLRPLLLAFADPARARVAAEALKPVLSAPSEIRPSRLLAYSDDPAVTTAIAQAIEREYAPRDTVILIAGHLRMQRIVTGCCKLVALGMARANVIEQFIPSLPRRELAQVAVVALGLIGDWRATPVLLQAAGETSTIRREAMAALGILGDPEAISLLSSIAMQKNHYYSPLAIHSIGQIGDQQTLPLLGDLLLDPQGEYVSRKQASWALVNVGGPLAADILRQQAARGDGDNTLTTCAAMEGLAFVGGAETEAVLMHGLSQKDTGVAAARSLGELNNPNLVPRLTEMLVAAAPQSGDYYQHLVSALTIMRHPAAGQALIESIPLAVQNGKIWEHAAALAGSFSPAAETALLAWMASERDPSARRAIARSLGKAGPESIRVALRLVESDPDPMVRSNCIMGFNYRDFGGSFTLPQSIWLGWATHANVSVRSTAIGRIASGVDVGDRDHDPFIPERLSAAMRDPTVEVRRSMLDGLGLGYSFSSAPKVREQFIALINDDPDPVIRARVAERIFHMFYSLINNDSENQFSGIADRLVQAACTDAVPQVRAEAAVTLLKFARQAADNWNPFARLSRQRTAVEQRVDSDPDPQVRKIIHRMLDAKDINQYMNVKVEWEERAPIPEPGPVPETPERVDF